MEQCSLSLTLFTCCPRQRQPLPAKLHQKFAVSGSRFFLDMAPGQFTGGLALSKTGKPWIRIDEVED